MIIFRPTQYTSPDLTFLSMQNILYFNIYKIHKGWGGGGVTHTHKYLLLKPQQKHFVMGMGQGAGERTHVKKRKEKRFFPCCTNVLIPVNRS